MADKTLNGRIQTKIDTASNWQSSTKPLLKGELAIDSTNHELRYGDGTNTYKNSARIADKKAATKVVGTSKSGHTTADCDYLCDGAADQVEINNAIKALPAGGGKVILLEGTYDITASVSVNKSNVTVEGMGFSTVLARNFTGHLIEVQGSNVNNVILENFKISGINANKSNTDNLAIYVKPNNNLNKIMMKKLTIENDYTGVDIAHSTYCSVENCNITGCVRGITCDGSTKCVFTGNYIVDSTYSIYMIWGAQHNLVSNNFINNATMGVFLENTGGTKFDKVLNNVIIDADRGIKISTSYNHIHGNCVIRGTGQSGDYSSAQSTITVDSGATYNDISGNYIMGKNYVNNGGTTNTFANNKYS